jgi:DNA-binding XRE family transcriptional regulator/tetratricopeptide (TPR) repeat protein
MQEASHHGQTVREYRESRVGITQEELARRIGRSRRTVVALEQSARIADVKLRRTLVWALDIPPHLLGIGELSLPRTVLTPVEIPVDVEAKNLSRVVLETFTENLRMRYDLYYLSSVAADQGLNKHIGDLHKLLKKSSSRDRGAFLILLSQNYQLKGLIARDQLDYEEAERCLKQASLLAQEAECAELDALAMGRRAVLYIWRNELDVASRLYETAREISRRAAPALRAYLATGHAEAQGMLQDQSCLDSLTDARNLFRRVDPEDDPLLLLRSTRCSERSITDGWFQCHVLLGKPEVALDYFDNLERRLDVTMARMRARLYVQYAKALYVSRDMSSCFYATEGLRLALSAGSRYNIQQVKDLAAELVVKFPKDDRVKDLLRELKGL